jgi:hypothetical protein
MKEDIKLEEEIQDEIKKLNKILKKKKNCGNKIPEKKFSYHTALYVTLGAAAIGVIAFIVLKNKK